MNLNFGYCNAVYTGPSRSMAIYFEKFGVAFTVHAKRYDNRYRPPVSLELDNELPTYNYKLRGVFTSTAMTGRKHTANSIDAYMQLSCGNNEIFVS